MIAMRKLQMEKSATIIMLIKHVTIIKEELAARNSRSNELFFLFFSSYQTVVVFKKYQIQYIHPIASVLKEYPNQPIVLIIEPVSLPNLATNPRGSSLWK